MLIAFALELYCTSPLKNMRGVTVKVARFESSRVMNCPSVRSTQFSDTPGSSEKRGDSSMRPPL